MAAEHESAERTAEEISQLLYRVQVIMLGKGIDARRRLPTSVDAARRPIRPDSQTGSAMLRIAVPNKGSLSEPASQMLTEAGYRQRTDSRELVLHRRRERHRVLLPAPARHRRSTSAPGRLDVGITGEDLLLDSGADGRGDPAARLRRLDVPVRRPCPGIADAVADLAGKRIATAYPGVVDDVPARATASTAEVIRLDGAVETAVRLDVADVDRRRRVDRHDAAQRRAGDLRRAAADQPGRAHPARRRRAAPARRAAGAPAAGRDHRPAVRADGLRHPRRARRARPSRSRPASSRRPCRRCTNKGWSAVRSMVERKRHQPGDGRAVGRSAPAASSSRTSTRADCERRAARRRSRARPRRRHDRLGGVGDRARRLRRHRDRDEALQRRCVVRRSRTRSAPSSSASSSPLLLIMPTCPRLVADEHERPASASFLGNYRTIPWDVVVDVRLPGARCASPSWCCRVRRRWRSTPCSAGTRTAPSRRWTDCARCSRRPIRVLNDG